MANITLLPKEADYLRAQIRRKYFQENKEELIESSNRTSYVQLAGDISTLVNGKKMDNFQFADASNISDAQLQSLFYNKSLRNLTFRDTFINACYCYACGKIRLAFFRNEDNAPLIATWRNGEEGIVPPQYLPVLADIQGENEENVHDLMIKKLDLAETTAPIPPQYEAPIDAPIATFTNENKALQNWKRATIGLAAAFLLAMGMCTFYKNQPQLVTWNLVTTWDGNGSYISEQLQILAREVDSTTEGGFKILIFNNLQIPNTGKSCTLKEVGKALEDDNASFQILHSSKYYYQWQDEKPAAIFFSAVPFGMDYAAANAWLGEKLWESKPTEGYRLWQKTFNSGNTISFPCGHTGAQWGGWYKKEITKISDFKGKNIRIAGFGGLVLQNLGAKTTFIPQYQILPAMYSDTFDMIEWINPVDDYKTGMYKTGHYKFVDDSEWNEPNSVFCMTMNKTAYNKLPDTYKKALVKAIEKMNYDMVRITTEASKYKRLIEKEGQIKYFTLKPEIQDSLKRLTSRLLYEHVQKHPEIQDVYESFLNHSDGTLRFKVEK